MIFGDGILRTDEQVLSNSTASNFSSSPVTAPIPTRPSMHTAPLREILLDEGSDNELGDKVAELREFFPHMTVLHIRSALLTCGGNVGITAALLMGDPSDVIRAKVLKLKSVFATSTDHRILDVLISSKGNVDDAAIHLKDELALSKRVAGTLESTVSLSGSLCQLSSSYPSPSASSSTASHVNGVVQSFKISTITHPTNSTKSKAIVNSVGQKDEEAPSKAVHARYVSLSPSIKSEEDHTYLAPVLEESFGAKVANLLAVLPNAGRRACENALQSCGGNAQDAYNFLESVKGHWDRSAGEEFGGFGLDRDGQWRKGEALPCDASVLGLKRPTSNMEGLSTKRPRLLDLEDDVMDDDEGSGESEIVRQKLLEPAGEWVRKYYPDGTPAKILLGPKEVLRNTIPKKLLYDNSIYFKQHFDAGAVSEMIDEEVRLPSVSPEHFDLALQCLVSKNITLEPNASRSKSAEITLILDLVLLTVELGLPDPGEPIVDMLRDILVDKRRILKPQHIQKAYTLAKGHGIRKLFVQATVQQYMKIRKNDISDNMPQYDSSDGEEIDEARRAAYPRRGFRYQREVDNITDFHLELLLEQDRILKSGEEEEIQAANKRTNKPAIMATVYADPLDEKPFLL